MLLQFSMVIVVMFAFMIDGISQPCSLPGTDYTIKTQFEIDNFNVFYPCNEFLGTLRIIDDNDGIDDIVDLTPLSDVFYIGSLIIDNNPNLFSLDGFSSLVNIGGPLVVSNSVNVINLNGFSALNSIEGDLFISNNSMLQNLNGLDQLNTVVGILFLKDNPSLTNLDGLSALTSAARLIIGQNDNLVSIEGLSGLTYLDVLQVRSNNNLISLEGLNNITSIGNSVDIRFNDALIDVVGLENIISVGGNFALAGNILLDICCAVKSLIQEDGVGGTISIAGNLTDGDCESVEDILDASCDGQDSCITAELSFKLNNLPPFCQGLIELHTLIVNLGDLPTPITYQWSHNLGDESYVTVGQNHTTYYVTVTDGNDCITVGEYFLSVDETNLLSSYTMITQNDLSLFRSTVNGGGVGVINADEVSVQNQSIVSSFMKSSTVNVDPSSTIATLILTEPDVTLPPFTSNPYNDYNNINVYSGNTVTLNGDRYGIIYNSGTIIFTNPQVYIKRIIGSDNAAYHFNQNTELMLQSSMHLGHHTDFNPTGMDVVVYSGDNVDVDYASNVIADIYAQEEIKVNSNAGLVTPTNMTGLFISNDGIESGFNVIWNSNPGCSSSKEGSKPKLGMPAVRPIDQLIASNKGIELFPNPSNGKFTLALDGFQEKAVNVAIYNLLGKLIWHKNIKKVEQYSMDIDLNQYEIPKGIYIVNILSEKERKSRRIVIE